MHPVAAALPYIDEHSVTIAASREVTWGLLRRVIEATAPGTFARILGCADIAASGPRPFAEGSVIPGFHVVVAEDPVELVLAGSHHFSNYALTFRLDDLGPSLSRLRAESRAEFPGTKGTIYRMLVIGTRVHVLATRRILAGVKRVAEHR